MSPPEREKPAPTGRLSPKCIAYNDSTAIVQGLHRRRAASQRLPVLDCRRSDPWFYPEPDERGYADYAAAASHLLELGLTPAPNVPAMRSMWKARGESQRVAWAIAERWEVIP
ncbi:hypothetical protein [Mycobacterium sp.]|uniref:hypothetical protein n=1 Tax=Mycobacterium sp. TaxID=1785 RepID=UPI003BB0F9C9